MTEELARLPGRRIGTTGVEVSLVGFGGANIGNLYRPVDDEQASASVNAAWDCGVRYFDTAPHYGVGLAERRLGAALADRPRDQYVLSTKVGRLLVPNETPTGSDLANLFDTPDTLRRQLDYSRAGVRRSIEASLDRLGLDRVDIALVHDPDDHVPQVLAEALPELLAMRDEGIIAAVGVGMNQWQAPLRFVQESDLDVVMVAGRWTLLDRSGEPLLAECQRRNVSVLSAAPFNSGLLAHSRPVSGGRFDYTAATPNLVATAVALAELAYEYGTTLPHVAMQFPLRHPAVASVVTGIGKPGHAETATTWATQPVPDDFWAAADRLVAIAGSGGVN